MDEFVDVGVIRGAGVYLLLYGDRVVYVGQSRRLWVRLYQHGDAALRPKHRYPGQPRTMKYDGIRCVHLPLDQLDTVERELIAHYKPLYNVSPGPAPKIDIAALLSDFPELPAPPRRPPTLQFVRRL